MPRSAAVKDARAQPSRAERARRLLAGYGISREDSDDELGLVDHPWVWIYEGADAGGEDANSNKENELALDEPASEQPSPQTAAPTRRNRRGRGGNKGPRIVGARMGSFECRIGESVLLKAEGTNEAWVGLICEFEEQLDDDADSSDTQPVKMANIMWFSTQKEIRNKQKKRTDFLPNELYITPSWDMNPLSSINGKAMILSLAAYQARYPSGKIPRNSHDYGKVFICRRGCNTRSAIYTDEFVWEGICRGHDDDVDVLVSKIQAETRATRKRRRDDKSEPTRDVDEGDGYRPIDEDGTAGPKTPRKKRKTHEPTTPRSQQPARTPQKHTTPTHRRFVVKKPLEFTPLGTRILSPSHIVASPFQVARSRLHVAAVPEALPCREQEFSLVYQHLEAAISEGTGSCIYISGTPGTGKTATVREAIARLNAAVTAEELDDFVFVEINGMKVTDPHQSYSLLWEALRGDRVSPAHALDLLEREFSNPSPRRVPCVVLMDELDQLVTKNQGVMYNFFNWPGLRYSRLIVLAVANTMDLPERTLSNKISSRLGLTRITFPGYTHDQLMQIIQSRLEGVEGGIVDPDAVQFASRKVAAVSGDARRALDICRRAVEIAEDENQRQQQENDDDDDEEDSLPATPSKTSRNAKARGLATEKKLPKSRTVAREGRRGVGGVGAEVGAKVTIATIKRAINEATTNPLQQYLRGLPLSSKVLLAAVLSRIRRTGVRESMMGDIIDDTRRLVKMVDEPSGRLSSTSGRNSSSSIQTFLLPAGRAPRLLGVASAAADLADVGVVGLEARRADRAAKLRLNVPEDEIKLALRNDPEVKGLGFAN